MKFEVGTSVLLAGLLMTDPVMAQAVVLQKKKERIMDTQVTEEMEDSHQVQERDKNPTVPSRLINETQSSHHEQQEVFEGNDRSAEKKGMEEQIIRNTFSRRHRRGRHGGRNRFHNVTVAEEDGYDDYFHEEMAVDTASSNAPDIGILATSNQTALDRGRRLQVRSCFATLPLDLRTVRMMNGKRRRRPGAKFTAPFCDQEFGYLGYWSLQDYRGFFLGQYCECPTACNKTRVRRCCAQACLKCNKNNGSPYFQKCGQYTANHFPGLSN